jgi:site-specific DNA recombinase
VAGETEPQPDAVLIQALVQARGWARSLRTGTSIAEIATALGCSEPYISARIPLAFLAPRLQTAILQGWQLPDLSVARLLREGIPMDWAEQVRRFGGV